MQIQIAPLNYYQEFVSALGIWSYNIYKKLNPEITIKSQIEKYKQFSNNIYSLPCSLVALDESQDLLGTCSLELEGIRQGLTPWLTSLYIVPSYRNKKIVFQLIDAIKDVARNNGYKKIFLCAFTEQQQKCFAKKNWSVLSKELYNNHCVVIMQTEL